MPNNLFLVYSMFSRKMSFKHIFNNKNKTARQAEVIP